MSIKNSLVIFSYLILSGCVLHAVGQQGSDQPTADAIMAAQAQGNQDAAYQESLQIEREQQGEIEQRRLMQQQQQDQQFRAHEQQQQTAYPSGNQPTSGIRRTGKRAQSPSNYDPARQNYDPSAGPYAKKPSWNAALDSATGHINPDNINYGGLLSQWHLAMAQETIGNVYFYIVVLESFALLIICLYAFHLFMERRHRLRIAGGVVTQLYNQYALARNKAYEAIRSHNALVDDKEDRLDSLLSDERPPELAIQSSRTDNPALDNSGHMIKPSTSGSQLGKITNDSAKTDIQNAGVVDFKEPHVDTEIIPEKAPILLANLDEDAIANGGHDGLITQQSNSSADELEVAKRQVETLQGRLRSKNIRINELEDALAVTSSTTKFPEV